MKRETDDESYIANKELEEAMKSDSKVRSYETINVESAPIILNEDSEEKQL